MRTRSVCGRPYVYDAEAFAIVARCTVPDHCSVGCELATLAGAGCHGLLYFTLAGEADDALRTLLEEFDEPGPILDGNYFGALMRGRLALVDQRAAAAGVSWQPSGGSANVYASRKANVSATTRFLTVYPCECGRGPACHMYLPRVTMAHSHKPQIARTTARTPPSIIQRITCVAFMPLMVDAAPRTH